MRLFLLLLLGCAHPPPTALPDPADALLEDPSALMPLDPLVTIGQLDNGLTWYAEPNTVPNGRLELRLVVRAGSVLEEEDQRGLAHMLEHMAFNGTEHYPGTEIVHWLESTGMRFGADINAHTGFDETVFQLSVPTDDPQVLDQAFGVLADQAFHQVLDPDELERERGVVLEEWRGGRGAGARIQEQAVQSTFYGSIYAERLPIGNEESLRTFTRDQLLRFYQDWYRPDLMAVVAVGDLPADEVERLVEAHFGPEPRREDPRPRPMIELPPHEDLLEVLADPEIPVTGGHLLMVHPEREGGTVGDYRVLLIRNLVFDTLNERLADMAQHPGAPFQGAYADSSRITPTAVGQSLQVATPGAALLPGLKAGLLELERMRRFGLTPKELDRARRNQASFYEQILREVDNTDSATGASEIVRVFANGEAMPGTRLEVALAIRLLASIDLSEVNAWAAAELGRGSRSFGALLPLGEDHVAPTPAELGDLLREVAAAPLTPPESRETDGPLVDPLPTPGRVVGREKIPELGVTLWRLSNGAQVWVKPTRFKRDQVLLAARSLGGFAGLSEADLRSAESAPSIVALSGLGDIDASTLSKRLAGVQASVSSGVGRTGESLSGGAAPGDLEAMFQLLYLRFTAPRFSPAALQRFSERQAEEIRNRDIDPGDIFGQAISSAMWGGSSRMRPWTEEDLAALDLQTSERSFKERFSSAADFNWVIVGSVDLATLQPLVERYIGSLPGGMQGEQPADDGVRPFEGTPQVEIRAGIEPKAEVHLVFIGPFEGGEVARTRLSALGDVLELRLRDRLREALGGTYGVGVEVSSSRWPEPGRQVSISFECDPARAEELLAATWEELGRLREEPVPSALIEGVKETNRRGHQLELASNGWWVDAISSALLRQEDPRTLLEWDSRNDALSAELIQQAARDWLDPAHVLTAVLLPAN